MDTPQALDDAEHQSFTHHSCISRRSNTVLYEGMLQGNATVSKSYTPEPLEAGGTLPEQLPGQAYPETVPKDDIPKYYYRKEAYILHKASQLPKEDQFAPLFYGLHEPSLTIYMEKIQEQTFRDYFQDGNNVKKKTQDLVACLVNLHSISGKHFTDFYEAIRWKTKQKRRSTVGLKPRSMKVEIDRWASYFATIVRYTSETFQEERRRKKKASVYSFIEKHLQCSLDEFTENFIKKDRDIMYPDQAVRMEKIEALQNIDEQAQQLLQLYREGYLTIVHGDFNPHNVFLGDSLKVCDFAEMRVGPREIDLASAVYNVYNTPKNAAQEMYNLELIREYVDRIKEGEEVSISTNTCLVRTLETRLKDGLRLFAVDCKYTPAEIRLFAPPHVSTDDDEIIKNTFLEEVFQSKFNSYFDYLLRGEGGSYISKLGEKGKGEETSKPEDISRAGERSKLKEGELLISQVEEAERFLRATGVLQKMTAPAKREKRFRDLIES